jgi:hypothetical protein
MSGYSRKAQELLKGDVSRAEMIAAAKSTIPIGGIAPDEGSLSLTDFRRFVVQKCAISSAPGGVELIA